MPNYDYRCEDCGKRSTIYLTYAEYDNAQVFCPHCSSENLIRRIGRVRIGKSEDARLDDLSDPSVWDNLDEDDPRSLAKMMRKMGSELGEDMPAEFDEVVDRLESGQSPEEIEESMPELAGGETDFGDEF